MPNPTARVNELFPGLQRGRHVSPNVFFPLNPYQVEMPLNPAGLVNMQAGPGVGQYIPTNSYLMSSAGQAGIRGLGCACGCNDCNGGMGTLGDGTGFMSSGLFNGQGVMGSGLFEGGFDPSSWGPAEWSAVAILGYVAWSVFFTTKQGVGYMQTVPARTRKAARSARSAFL